MGPDKWKNGAWERRREVQRGGHGERGQAEEMSEIQAATYETHLAMLQAKTPLLRIFFALCLAQDSDSPK